MRVLVTGGSGFIGSNFVRFLLERGESEVVNLDKLTYAGSGKNLEDIERDPRYTFVNGDICDPWAVRWAMRGCDTVVHFAAETHVDRSIGSAAEFVRTNVLGTQVLLDVVREKNEDAREPVKIRRFHHVSTDEVFGQLGPDGRFNEESVYDPRSPYSASKAGADFLVRAAHTTHRLPVTISNCSNNYGPWQFPEKVIPLFVTNLLDGKRVPLYGEGGNVRDWLHVRDHCAAIDRILREGVVGETYAIGGDTELSNLDLTMRILRGTGHDASMIERVPDRKGHDFRYAIDHGKITRELGWSPEIPFDQGLEETIRWYRDHRAWWERLKT